MTPEQQLQYLLDNESEKEVVEFKEAKNNFDFRKLGKYFSALSNEANLKGLSKAWLVLGVRDDKTICGSDFRINESDLQSLKQEVANQTSNRITFTEIYTVQSSEGRVILFEIPPAVVGLPTAFQGHYFGRDGSSLNALNLEELERIRQQNKYQDWSIGICTGATIFDLDPDAIKKAREEYLHKHPKHASQLDAWDDATFLNKAKLTIQGKITRAAILLLGKAEASHFLNPASPTISWILKSADGIEKDYEHFSCPLLLQAEKAFQKIRNLKYRYMAKDSLFPDEVDQYDPYIIREALNNAIAHQDYELGGKVNIVEFEDGRLSFHNMGQFIPGSVKKVIQANAPESRYRNRFLTDAMVNLNMIDTIGSGIRKMFMIQKNRYFPLPEYDLSENYVEVTIVGRVIDMNYALKLVQMPELTLGDIILLDRVQKKKSLTSEEAKYLKQKGLLEGRKPNFHISASLAKQSGSETEYIHNKALDDKYYKDLICEYLGKFTEGKRRDFEQLLLDKLPNLLDEKQKKNKVKNLLQALKNQGFIENNGKIWQMSKSEL